MILWSACCHRLPRFFCVSSEVLGLLQFLHFFILRIKVNMFHKLFECNQPDRNYIDRQVHCTADYACLKHMTRIFHASVFRASPCLQQQHVLMEIQYEDFKNFDLVWLGMHHHVASSWIIIPSAFWLGTFLPGFWCLHSQIWVIQSMDILIFWCSFIFGDSSGFLFCFKGGSPIQNCTIHSNIGDGGEWKSFSR